MPGYRIDVAKYGIWRSKQLTRANVMFGLALLAFGVTMFVRSGRFEWFMVLWAVLGLVIIGLHLWAAFNRKGRFERRR
jgi:hypothetical protein